LAALQASGGVVEGRTRLQKLVYFASRLLGVEAGYRPHFYGPYSSEVASVVDSQVSRGVAQEVRESLGFAPPQFPGHDGELRRYSYVLTPDGKEAIQWHREQHKEDFDRAVSIMGRLVENAPNWKVLCYAAKLLHILQAEDSPLTYDAAAQRAQDLGWDMSPEEVGQGVDLLKDLDLVTTR
jgi:hypothetical protein